MKFITFDITNTLIKVSPSVGFHYSNLAKKFNYEFDADSINHNFRHFFKEQNKLQPGYGFKAGVRSKDWWQKIVRNLMNENSKSKNFELPNEAKIEQIAENIFTEFSKSIYWKKYENCDLVLEGLKRNGFELGVVSNFDERLHEIVKNLELDKYFDFILIPSNAAGHAKPDPQIFLKAFELSKMAKTSDLVHVGDDYELDFKAAQSIGFKTILMRHQAKTSNENLPNSQQANNLLELLHKIKKTF